MKLNEEGFRAVYKTICAFELNDYLRDVIKDCPEAEKSNYAVFYGFIDPKKGLMLELLGAGKQAPKYFYFKDPYEGKRVSIPASKVADVECVYFEKVPGKYQQAYDLRIKKLKKHFDDEALEKTRKFGFLDGLRDPQFPDDVKVRLMREGVDPEDVWVRMTAPGDHEIRGIMLNQPHSNFGLNKGDEVGFNVHEMEDKSIICYIDCGDGESEGTTNEFPEITIERLLDGSLLREAIHLYDENESDETFTFVMTVLRSSRVVLPCETVLDDSAQAVIDRLSSEGKEFGELSDEERATIEAGIHTVPKMLSKKDESGQALPLFSDKESMGDHPEDIVEIWMPFFAALDTAIDMGEDIEGIIVNPFTDPFFVSQELFEKLKKHKPVFSDEQIDAECRKLGETQEDDSVAPVNHHGTNRQYYKSDMDIRLTVGKMDVFNFALYQNGIPPIRGIQIENNTGNTIEGLSLKITSDYHFFKLYEAPLPPIPSGKPVPLVDPRLVINGRMLGQLTEAENTLVTVELIKDDEPICGYRQVMEVLAYDQYQGHASYRDLLPAFVLPNHPVIATLMHDVSDQLTKWGKDPSLEGYQCEDPNRVRDFAAAAFAAIQKKNIVYANPPASFAGPGQRIRTPETIMEQRMGTCMDMTLFYAALLEQIGLHPVLTIIKGHIFAGVWLRERSLDELKSGSVVIDDLSELTKHFGTGTDDMTFVECTMMCSGKKVNFEDAERVAKEHHLTNAEQFECAIDVELSRRYGVKPLSSRVKNEAGYQVDVAELSDDEVSDAPKHLGLETIDVSTTPSKPKVKNKRELWESKLLDLSARNMLLNLPLNASIKPIMSSHIDELEDALADGHEFHLQPIPEWLASLCFTTRDKDGKESKPKSWLAEAIKECGVLEMTEWPVSSDFDFNEKFRQEYRNHRLYTYCTDKQLDKELTTIYRAARASQQENGVSCLYLAIGLLRWFEPDVKEPHYAPLILVPIEIVRKAANQGYALHARDEEPHFNTTLLEMLRQQYNLDIAGLEPLPGDEHGIHVKKIFKIVRNHLLSVQGWDVVETCVIGNFSFAQFAMWNDIHTCGNMLEGSNVVRSLMKGHIDWDVQASQSGENSHTYLPITVDGTQLKAVKMAAAGKTFVLHGPPGTGKSQTITGMIANLLAQGKTVLFVAEKMAALSVVQRRLSQLGIGDFCLEVHSDKANKKHVLSQMERAVNVIKYYGIPDEYSERCQRTEESRSKLDSYAQHLHHVYDCGYTLRELIDHYEAIEHRDVYIPFTREAVSKLSKEQIRAHIPQINQLLATGMQVKHLFGSPFTQIGITNYHADLRSQLRQSIRAYKAFLGEAKRSGEETARILGLPSPNSKADLTAIANKIVMFRERSGADPELITFLELGTTDARAWFDQEQLVMAEEARLLDKWRADFLTRDMQQYLDKVEDANSKWFGKAKRMDAITSEIQTYALRPIVFDQIPELTSEITAYQKHKEQLQTSKKALPEALQQILVKYSSWDAYYKAYRAAEEYRSQADSFPGGLQAILELAKSDTAQQAFDAFNEACERLDNSANSFNSLVKREASTDCGDWFTSEENFCDFIIESTDDLKEWILYNQHRRDCIESGLLPVVQAFESGMDRKQIIPAYKSGLYYALINFIISNDEVLFRFTGTGFNEAIRLFKEQDDALLEETKKELCKLLALGTPDSWASSSIGMEMNYLRKAISSNARGTSLRDLFQRIPNILPKLCPCMLMSPNSVAQYLEQKNDMFDIVIFDEASQLPTCKAVGALARAKNAVIVGDPKQMPPTSFFAGSGPEVEDLALADLDSILDDALALGIPSQHLQWHYRSTHESLIAFSNSQFYDNKMYTFPSANDRERHVTSVLVDGIYSKSTNVKEAEAVVGEIVRRFLDPKLRKQSIGVVTFNQKQQTLIENLLAKQFSVNPELDIWANSGDDPLFVKNLENVQGDERDVILFSICYGPDEKGHISMNFGPINSSGGGKRLNVAFSRARITMTIFTSMRSTDIKVTETSPEGVIAFRDFLKFAEGTDIIAAQQKETRRANAGILNTLCHEIRNAGYECETMVGHSDFHVDIAVVDPYFPTQYLMGILLDGDGYKKTSNTRDREISQIGVLNHLGWELHRVWAVDWWDNRKKQIRKLLNRLDELKTASEIKASEIAQHEAEQKGAEEAREAETARVRAELEQQAVELESEEQEDVVTVVPTMQTLTISETEDKEGQDQSGDSTKTQSQSVDQSQDAVDANASGEDVDDSQGDGSSSDAQTVEESKLTGVTEIFKEILGAGGEFVDKRDNGGALWIVGGANLKPIIRKLNAFGVAFLYKAGGGKATGGRDGWWAKTDIPLPDLTAIPDGEIADERKAAMVLTGEPQDTISQVIEVAHETQHILPVPYISAELEDIGQSSAEFTSSANKAELIRRISLIVDVEGPILKDTVLETVRKSCGVGKGTPIYDSLEKAFKAAKIKTSKVKGTIICWRDDQEPKEWNGIRISNTRRAEELTLPEIKNAAVFVLKQTGPLDRDKLAKEISTVFGYQRLGKNLVTAITDGIAYAKSIKAIKSTNDGKFEIVTENTQ